MFLNLCQCECEQWQQNGDDNMVGIKLEHQVCTIANVTDMVIIMTITRYHTSIICGCCIRLLRF